MLSATLLDGVPDPHNWQALAPWREADDEVNDDPRVIDQTTRDELYASVEPEDVVVLVA